MPILLFTHVGRPRTSPGSPTPKWMQKQNRQPVPCALWHHSLSYSYLTQSKLCAHKSLTILDTVPQCIILAVHVSFSFLPAICNCPDLEELFPSLWLFYSTLIAKIAFCPSGEYSVNRKWKHLPS